MTCSATAPRASHAPGSHGECASSAVEVEGDLDDATVAGHEGAARDRATRELTPARRHRVGFGDLDRDAGDRTGNAALWPVVAAPPPRRCRLRCAERHDRSADIARVEVHLGDVVEDDVKP